MSAVMDWPAEPTRPDRPGIDALADPDAPLVVLIRAHYPHLTYNIVASAGQQMSEDGRYGYHLWYVSGTQFSYPWDLIPAKVLPRRSGPVRVEVFRMWPESWPLASLLVPHE